ncbi:molybdopterin-dependent oxidoreductase [Chloroflexota bacterium]
MSTAGQEIIKDGACAMCGAGRCATKIHIREGKATKIDMIDQGVIDTCPRWKAQLDFVYHPDRLKYPLKRTGERGEGSFTRISWDEALDTVTDKFQEIKAEYGAESVVFYISLPKEPRPYFHRLAHAFGSPNYCTESSNCSTATRLANILNFGDGPLVMQDGMRINPDDKCKLIWSSGVRHSSPAVWKNYLAAKRNGLKFIVVDPRRTEIAGMADVYLQLRPGTDGALALGMMNVIINEHLYDKEFIEKWTVGFEELEKLVREYPPEKVEQITSVPATKVREAAVLFATEKPASLRTSPGAVVHGSNGVQNQRAVTLLLALTGNLGVPDGRGGVQGTRLPVPTNDITLHERIADLPPGLGADRFPIWIGQFKEMQSNVLADRIESGDPYPIKALFAAGPNITFFADCKRITANLKKLDFIVATDYFHNAGTQLADVVLPIASWLERPMLLDREGGHLKLVEPAIEPIGESWPEWQIFAALAERLGFGHEYWDGDFDKCLNHVIEPSGITVENLRRSPEGIKYAPPPTPARQIGFQTPSGKVEIASSILEQHGHDPLPVYKEPVESPVSRPDLAASFPLVLTSGARTVYYTHSQFRNIAQLRQAAPDPLAEINPSDAEPRGIQSGDTVTISSPRGSIKVKANVTDTIIQGAVHVMHHWPGEANVNILSSDQNLDPISGFAPFKSQLCQIARA